MTSTIFKRTFLYLLGKMSQLDSKRYLQNLSENFVFDPKRKRIIKRKYPFQILIYHRVLPVYDPFAIDVTTSRSFEEQIRHLSSYFKIMSLEDLVDDLLAGKQIRNALCITFDDGYFDNYLYAFPILKKYNVPATIFLTTDYISSKNVLWFDKVLLFLKNTGINQIDLGISNGRLIDLGSLEKRIAAVEPVLEHIKTLNKSEMNNIISYMEKNTRKNINLEPNRMMNWEEIKEMSESGIYFGSHTRSHAILSKISSDEIWREISESKTIIEEKINKEVKSFAYPNGQINDFNDDCIKQLIKADYKCAVSTLRGNNYSNTDRFQLRRIAPWDEDPVSFLGRVILYRLMD